MSNIHIFKLFSNFDGVRFAFHGIPVVVFKLKTAVNVDELIGLQNFEFKRTSTRQNRTHVGTIGYKIQFRGMAHPYTKPIATKQAAFGKC